jgi:type III secretion system YscQ/HrcQ family protein
VVILDWIGEPPSGPVFGAGTAVRLAGRRRRTVLRGQLIAAGASDGAGLALRLSAVDTTLVRTDPEVSKESRMSASSEASSGGRVVDDVELTLVAELGRITVTVEEAAALAPGQVLGLGRALESGVTLTVEGRRVARGQLVDIDGEIGIRILDLG